MHNPAPENMHDQEPLMLIGALMFSFCIIVVRPVFVLDALLLCNNSADEMVNTGISLQLM